MVPKRTAEEIESLLARYDARGNLTRRTFCESEGLSLPSLDYYLRRRAPAAVRLARVKVTDEAWASEGRYALVLRSGRRIECGPAELAQLIAAAEQA